MLQSRRLRGRSLRKSGTVSNRSAGRTWIESLEVRQLMSVYMPSQIRQAYGFDKITFKSKSGQTVAGDGAGQTIAIVDAYDDPNIANDLKIFDAQFKISDNDSTGAFALTKATPSGQPASNSGWAQEIALDVEWAHAIAPGAHILLVEAKSSSLIDLLSAEDYARAQPGVVAVSNSWGTSEFSAETAYDNHFTTPSGHGGITFTVASGDAGAPAEWPAVAPTVLAVGGTSLTLNSGGYQSETSWRGSGGGYSRYEKKPTYQNSVQTSSARTNPDVSYDSDPNTGYYVYDSVPVNHQAGWWQIGGTSAAAPQWAALIAIADQGRGLAGKGSLDGATQTLPAIYQMAQSDFHDITSGSNGYAASTGYDLVTGRGTPVAGAVINDLIATGSSSGSSSATSKVATTSPSNGGSPGSRFATSNVLIANQNTTSATVQNNWSDSDNDILTTVSDRSGRHRAAPKTAAAHT